MKLIIEISEEVYQHYKNTPLIGTPDAICWPDEIKKAVRKATPISDNATNGDVIQALFGGMQINDPQNENDLVYIEHLYFGFPAYWWNSPYKENRHEEN